MGGFFFNVLVFGCGWFWCWTCWEIDWCCGSDTKYLPAFFSTSGQQTAEQVLAIVPRSDCQTCQVRAVTGTAASDFVFFQRNETTIMHHVGHKSNESLFAQKLRSGCSPVPKKSTHQLTYHQFRGWASPITINAFCSSKL